METTEFTPLFEEITRPQKIMRQFLDDHTQEIPHDQDRIRLELPLLNNTADIVTKKWALQILWVLEN